MTTANRKKIYMKYFSEGQCKNLIEITCLVMLID